MENPSGIGPKILLFFKSLVTPRHKKPDDGISYWQERVLLLLLFFSVAAGLITYIPSLLLSIKEQLWVIAVADTLMYAYVLFMFFRPDLPYPVRAVTFPVVSYVLGMVLIVTLGPFGAGPVWLFFFPVITAILLGAGPAALAIAVNGLTALLLGVIIFRGETLFLSPLNFKDWYFASVNPVEKWVVISLNFLFLNTVATVCVNLVFNGLQKTIIRLDRSRRKYRRIFENILDVYIETTPEGLILLVSPSIEAVSLHTIESLKGKSLFDIYVKPELGEKTLVALGEKGFVRNHEIQLKDADGSVRDCSINAQMIRNEDGRREKIIGILRDISDIKTIEKEKTVLEEQLNRSRKMEALGLLAGGVAHDLNNVLSGIVTYPEVLFMELESSHPLRKPLEVIHSSGLKAAEIVQDLLTLARRGVVSKEKVDMNQVVKAFINSPECKKMESFHPHVKTRTILSAKLPFVNGSAVHLGKTLMNLYSNAFEAQISPGVVTVRTENRHIEETVNGYDRIEKGDYFVLSVQDQGAGISKEDLSQIFEPFFTKKVMGRSGTGLGMAVVWGTVRDHDGFIDIITEPGQGSCFELYLPVSAEQEGNLAAPVDIEDLKGNGELILVVDDVKSQRDIAVMALTRLGYTATSVDSGEAAISYFNENKADLLILDMIMDPGIDGYETYRQICRRYPGQKAIIASGYSQTDKVEKAMVLGVGQYLKKPYSMEQLGLAVKIELAKPRES